ncbi:MAG: sporulation transcription factor Spo0A [Clostridiaceae bacterium]|nr:sporulation transcription factor Spo0A [Eubacteriales bacterium]
MKKIRLQIVDDNLEYCLRMEEYMLSSGYFDILPSAHDGAEALKYFETELPDVALVDMVMPHMDGIELLRQLRQRGYAFKVVANSPFIDEEIVRMAQGLGASYFLAKPMEFQYVLARVMEVAGAGMDESERTEFQSMLARARRDVNRDEIVANYLRAIGLPAHVTGYWYLKESIDYWVERYGQPVSLTKQVYPHVAQKFGTTATRVERNLRHAIECAWDNGGVASIDAQHKLFGYTVNDAKGRPTNKEFIAMIADRTVHRLKRR